jgi:hypothetical protein
MSDNEFEYDPSLTLLVNPSKTTTVPLKPADDDVRPPRAALPPTTASDRDGEPLPEHRPAAYDDRAQSRRDERTMNYNRRRGDEYPRRPPPSRNDYAGGGRAASRSGCSGSSAYSERQYQERGSGRRYDGIDHHDDGAAAGGGGLFPSSSSASASSHVVSADSGRDFFVDHSQGAPGRAWLGATASLLGAPTASAQQQQFSCQSPDQSDVLRQGVMYHKMGHVIDFSSFEHLVLSINRARMHEELLTYVNNETRRWQNRGTFAEAAVSLLPSIMPLPGPLRHLSGKKIKETFTTIAREYRPHFERKFFQSGAPVQHASDRDLHVAIACGLLSQLLDNHHENADREQKAALLRCGGADGYMGFDWSGLGSGNTSAAVTPTTTTPSAASGQQPSGIAKLGALIGQFFGGGRRSDEATTTAASLVTPPTPAARPNQTPVLQPRAPKPRAETKRAAPAVARKPQHTGNGAQPKIGHPVNGAQPKIGHPVNAAQPNNGAQPKHPVNGAQPKIGVPPKRPAVAPVPAPAVSRIRLAEPPQYEVSADVAAGLEQAAARVQQTPQGPALEI